jgi:hypothetical protein
MSQIANQAISQDNVAEVCQNNRPLQDHELDAVAGGGWGIVGIQLKGWPSPIYYPVPCSC